MNIIATDATSEARRVLEICNACRYCEGLCATFQAMTQHRTFADADIDHLANLCHHCTACLPACQYAPPHEFGVSVPRTLARVRVESYERYAWPGRLSGLFTRNVLVTALLMILVVGLAFAMLPGAVLFGRHVGDGAFYEVVSHGLMILVAGATFGFSVLAMSLSVRRYWRASGGAGMPRWGDLAAAGRDAARLRYLDGPRRLYHHCTMWGFLLCFAATSVATFYHYGLDLVAPYAYLSWPVVLGTAGGLGLIVGPLGLLREKRRADPEVNHPDTLDSAFLVNLILVSATGLILLALRETAAMGLLLVVHLGSVLAFFVLLPYSRFVHGAYRFAALVRFAQKR